MDGYGCMTTEQARFEMDKDEFEAWIQSRENSWELMDRCQLPFLIIALQGALRLPEPSRMSEGLTSTSIG